MNLEKLFRVLSAIHPLSKEFKERLKQDVVPLSLPKGHFLLEAPKISDHAYFIEKGFALSYSFVDGKKQIENFYDERQIVISAKSFFEQVPSKEFIQLIEPSEILYISHLASIRILDMFPEANTINRILLSRLYDQSKSQVNDLHNLSAYDRYKTLRDRHPRIEQLISQEYLASYLGITPQSLSRLKKRHSPDNKG